MAIKPPACRDTGNETGKESEITYIASGRQEGIYANAIARIKESPLAVAILEHKERHPELY